MTMNGISRAFSVGIFILGLMINLHGHGVAKKFERKEDFNLTAIESKEILIKSERLWDQGIIPYGIRKNFFGEQRRLITRAIKYWENITCVQFIESVRGLNPSYLFFTTSPNCSCCSPSIGKYQEGRNSISFDKSCSYESVVHELGHAIGFSYHKLSNDNKFTNATGTQNDTKEHFNKDTSKNLMIRDRQDVKDIFYQCPKCGKTLQAMNGTFGTFDTQIYSNSSLIEAEESCEWRISGAHGERIALNIESLNIYESINCTTDYLEIRDGYWSGSPLLGRFCGYESITQPLITLSNRMLVTYVRTTGKKSDYGFTASYYKLCGGDIEINNTRVYLESPNYPYDYERNVQCTWIFNSPKDQKMRVQFYNFYLEESRTCKNDFLEIRDGDSYKSSLIGRYCGSHKNLKTYVYGGTLVVKFFSKNPTNYSGFSMAITAYHEDNDNKKIQANETIASPDSADYRSCNPIFVFICLFSIIKFFN